VLATGEESIDDQRVGGNAAGRQKNRRQAENPRSRHSGATRRVEPGIGFGSVCVTESIRIEMTVSPDARVAIRTVRELSADTFFVRVESASR
jgi:hypothetical protein